MLEVLDHDIRNGDRRLKARYGSGEVTFTIKDMNGRVIEDWPMSIVELIGMMDLARTEYMREQREWH